jgi:hypothetical protein
VTAPAGTATARSSPPNALTRVGSLSTVTTIGSPKRSWARSANVVTTQEMAAVSTVVTRKATSAHKRFDQRRAGRAGASTVSPCIA